MGTAVTTAAAEGTSGGRHGNSSPLGDGGSSCEVWVDRLEDGDFATAGCLGGGSGPSNLEGGLIGVEEVFGQGEVAQRFEQERGEESERRDIQPSRPVNRGTGVRCMVSTDLLEGQYAAL